MLKQLTPHFVIDPPIPGEAIAERIGSLLSMTCAELSGPESLRARLSAQKNLHVRIHDLIATRCSEHVLSESDLAIALGVLPDEVARALAERGETFEGVVELNRVRVERIEGWWPPC